MMITFVLLKMAGKAQVPTNLRLRAYHPPPPYPVPSRAIQSHHDPSQENQAGSRDLEQRWHTAVLDNADRKCNEPDPSTSGKWPNAPPTPSRDTDEDSFLKWERVIGNARALPPFPQTPKGVYTQIQRKEASQIPRGGSGKETTQHLFSEDDFN